MNSISFDNVYLLLIALPLIAVFMIPFLAAIRKENRNWHNVTSQVLHIVMAIIVAFAAAGTHITQLLTQTEVYVVADVSYSANKNLDTIDNYIKNLKLPRNSKVGLVCFGKDSKLISDLDKLSKIASVKNSGVDDSETNISAALQYTGSLFRDDVIKRIVLITDGKQTSDNDTYSIKRAVDSLEAQNVKVDAIYIDDNITSDTKEVQITKVNFTSSAFLNHDEVANVYIDSNYETSAIVSLYLKVGMDEYKKVDEAEKVVDLEEGQTVVNINLDTSESGSFDYQIRVEAVGDESNFNNTYTFSQDVAEEMKVLAITNDNKDDKADCTIGWKNALAIAERYNDRASIDIYGYTRYTTDQLVELESYKNVTVHSTKDVPYSIEDLSKYDEIILADVDIAQLTSNSGTSNTEFANNLEIFVSKFGKSLVTFGNTYVQSKDDNSSSDSNAADRVFALSRLGDMLPVNYGNVSDENKVYAIVMDTSRSMAPESSNTISLLRAQQTAIKLIDGLSENDWFCVLTFNSRVDALRPNARKGDTQDVINEVKDKINNVFVKQGGLAIGAALQDAYDKIKATPVSNKEIILITDGVEYTSSPVDAVKVVGDIKNDDDITTTVFNVNFEITNTEVNNYLEQIATAGGGTYYSYNDTVNFNGMTGGGSSASSQQNIITGQTKVSVKEHTDEVFTNIDQSKFADISGYFYNTRKSGAVTPLVVTYKKKNNNSDNTNDGISVSLYSYWNYGNGKVSSFASSFAGSWTQSWEDSLSNSFFNNLFTQSIPSQKSNNPYNLEISQDGKSAFVRLTPAIVKADTTADIRILNPNNQMYNKTMSFNSESFFYEFDTLYMGKYEITVTYNYNGKSYISTQSFSLSYPPEYDSYTVYGVAPLYQALDGRGKVSLDGKLDISKDDDEVATYSVDLTVMLLIICVVLFVIDIIIRKLKWEDIKTFFGFDKKKEVKKSEGDKK